MAAEFPKFKSKRLSNGQLLAMISFMEKHPETLSTKFTPNFTKIDRKKLWEELTCLLNSDGFGPKKDSKGWQKSWSDQKCNIRAKAAKISAHRDATGGGPQTIEKLTDVEERILCLVGRVSAEGNADILEAGFNTDAPAFVEVVTDYPKELFFEKIEEFSETTSTAQTPPVRSMTSTPQFPEDMTKCDESHILIQSVAENENLAMNAEVTEQYMIHSRKDKESLKQNVFSETVSMKYKIQPVHNNDQENFKSSARFKDVDKVDLFEGTNDLKYPVDSESSISKQNRNHERMILTKSTITKEKTFENVGSLEDEKEDTVINSDENMKTRFLLNMEEYKHYNENLKLTRDWLSEHRTYSHLQVYDNQSSESPYFTSLQSKCIQNNHRMKETTESSNLSSITSDSNFNPNMISSQLLEVLESSQSVSSVPMQSNEVINKPFTSTACNANKTFQVDLNKVTFPELFNSAERSGFGTIIKSGRNVCYKNIPQLSNKQNNIKTPRPKSRKCQNFITYGRIIPCDISKPEKPHVFINSNTIDQNQETIKRDCNKFSGNIKNSHLNSVKLKRGRSSKVKPDLAKHLSSASDSKNKIKKNIEKNAMKDRAPLLRRIKKDTKNRYEKLCVGNRKENLKCDITAENDKKIQTDLESTFLVVNSITQKQGIDGKIDAPDESVIQCQENIDNLLCNNELNTSHVQSLAIENCLINDLDCIIPDDNVITSREKESIVADTEHYAGNDTNNTGTLEMTTRIESSPASSRINFVKNTKYMNTSLVITSDAKNTFELYKTDPSSENHSSPIAKTVIPKEALDTEDGLELNVDPSEINQKTVTPDVSYKNIPQLSNKQNNIKTPRPKSRKCQNFITYGRIIPCDISKPEKPHVFINSSTIDQNQETIKRDCNKFSGNIKNSHLNSVKLKRGRSSKVKPDLAKHLSSTSDSKNKIKKNIEKNAMKDRAPLLRRIKKDTKNRYEKLCVGNRKENLKCDITAENDKKIQTDLESTFLVVNSITQKQGIDGKVDAPDESVIQCQENIDNLLCNNELNTSHVQSLAIENCLINDLDCIIPEDNAITSREKVSVVSDTEHYAGNDTNNTGTLEMTTRIESPPASSRINFVKNTKYMNTSLVITSDAKNTFELYKTDPSSENHSSPIAKTVIPKEALDTEDGLELNVDPSEINQKTVTPDVSSNLRSTSKSHLIDFSGTNQKAEIMSKEPFSIKNSTVSHEINYSENNPEVIEPGLSKTPHIQISLEFHKTDHPKLNHQNENNTSQVISTAENVPKSLNLDFSKLNKKNIDLEMIPDTENSSIPFKVDTKCLVNSQEASVVKNSYQSNENYKADEIVSENSTPSGMLSIVETTPKSNLYSGSKENFNHITSLQVKRSRGRPRRNHINESSPNFSSVHTVLLNASGINTRDKINDGEDCKTVCSAVHKKEQFSSVCRNRSNLHEFYGDNSDINKKIEGCSQQLAGTVHNDFKSIVNNSIPNEKNEIALPLMVSAIENVRELLVVEHQTNQEVRKFNVDGNFEINNGCKSPAKNSSILNNVGKNAASEISSITRSYKIHHSESNKNFENISLGVKIKRPRGKPKSNCRKHSVSHTSSVHILSPNTSDINQEPEIRLLENTERGQSEAETTCFIAKEDKHPIFAKERAKKNDSLECHADNSKSQQKIEIASQVVACAIGDDLKSSVDFLKTDKKIGTFTPVIASNLEHDHVFLKVDNCEVNHLTKNVNLEVTFEGEKDCESSQVKSYRVNEGDKNSTMIEISGTARSEQTDHSEPNREIENVISDVKVKKPRGRPKKNQNVEIINSNLESTFEGKKDCESSQVNSYRVNEGDNNSTLIEISGTARSEQADHSEPNQEIKNVISDVKVKKPRGRPKKNHNVEMINSNLESTFEGKKDCESSQVNSYRVNEGDKNSTIVEISGTARLDQKDHSEPYQKIENVILDVKAKKPRGRPKKSQNVGMISSNLESTFEEEKDCESSQVNSYTVNEGDKNSIVVEISGTARLDLKDHSEPYQKIENVISDVKAKKPRGRPKKSQNVGMISSNLESTFEEEKDCESSQVNSYRVNERDKNSIVVEISGTTRSEQTDHSEPNQKIENVISDVKVKKPRGRPKKKQNVVMINISKPLSFSNTLSNADKLDESKDTCNTKGTLSESAFSVTGERKHKVVYKSERLKNLKLVKDKSFESSQSEIKKDIDPPSFRGKRRRGRPRKIPSKDFIANILDEETETNFAVENSLNMEPKSVKNNLIKYSHRSRPRKYKKRTNFKLGFDMSNHLHRLNNNTKKKVRYIKTGGRKKEKFQDLKYKEKLKKKEQETISFLLKKRKPKMSKRDDFVYEESYNSNSSDTDILESLLDAEEDMEIDHEDKVTESKNEQKYKNLRKHKNDASARKKQMKRNSCDPEFVPSYFCNRKDKSSITPAPAKKKSYKRISYAGKGYIKINNQSSSPNELGDNSFVHRKISPNSITRSKKLRKAALREFFHVPGSLFPDFKPQKCTWKPLKDYYLFSPLMRFSPYFKTKSTWNGSESNWISLSVFESAPIDRESCHSTFFTGGSVSCSAWCPTSMEDKSIQYVALAVSCSLEAHSFYDQTHSKKGLIQLWSVGTLLDKKLNSRPSMQLSIALDYGPITDMAWCPKGCWEEPSTECLDNTLPRLGMLAVACSDGNVRVYSIPHPDFLMNESTFPVYESCPSIILQPMFGERCNATKKSMSTCLSWQKSDNCERVSAGYSSGMICIWRISNIASFLVSNENNQTNIKPYLVFNAHGTPVTSISFAPLPGSRFLASSSYDRTLKFWDLLDISLPFFTVKKGPARCAEWANHFCGVFASLDNGMNCIKGSCFFKESGTENFPAHSLSNTSCFVTKSTVSEYLEAQALVDISGCTSVSFFYNLAKDNQKSPYYFHRPVYFTEIVAVEGIMEKIAFSSSPKSSDCHLAIQDMKDIVTHMNEVTEMIARKSLDADSVDKSEKRETERSYSASISSENILESKCNNVNTGDVHYINITNELITVKSVSKLCDINDSTSNQSNICSPLIQNFEDKHLNENVDQLMLFGENENFNSENQMSFSDENVTDLFFWDSKQSFSDDSVTPESSLDLSISSSHFSSQSDRSSSPDLETIDHELNMTFLCTSNQSNTVGASLLSSELPLGSLTSEFSQVSSCKRKEKCANFKSDSTASMFLEKVVASQNDKLAKTEATSISNEEIMPSSHYAAPIPSENPLPICNELNKMEIVDTSLESAAVDDISLEGNINKFNKRVLDNAVFTNSSKGLHTYAWNKSDIFSVNKLCDINSGCHKMSKNHVDIPHVALTDNTKNVNTKHACMYLEKNYQSDCNMVKPFPKPQNIFDFKLASKPIVNNDNKVNRNETTNNQLCDKNHPPSISSSYETVISHYGLVFKDMNTADFKSIEDLKVEEDNSLLHDGYNIASLKTAAWNPNYGSHFWLFSAGQSGLARISYISDMDESDSFPSMGGNNS